jgi:glycosyltransferase involved in cell wall biosynthesis
MEQARNNRLSAQENYQRAKLQSERSQREMLVRQLADAAEANARLNCNLDEAHQRVEARDVRIEQLRRSFSWQITSPLRSLRRLLVDPFHKPSPAPARPLPKPDPGLRHAIDEPTDWKAIPPSGTLRGWVISSDSQGIVGVRVRFNRTAFNAIFGLMRADLTTAFPGHPHAGLSGFTLEYAVEPNTDQTLILEALTVDGRWRCFASNAARVVPESTTTPRHDYGSWIRAYDTLTLEKSVALQARLEALAPPQRPLISVLMPVYNTPAQWLNKAIESVVAQLYPQWELCIADDASTEPHVRPILDEWVRRDPRVRVTYREQNGHISHASNSALELVRGEFIALFDHDDELAPDALAEVVLALAARADADVIYSDEDKIDELGQRFWPYFKPDFLPDLLAGQNFVSHLSVLRTTLVRGVGGFRPGYEGSQDWDLLLRVIEKSSPDRVQHIPKVLYHWRAISGSTARAVSEKDYSSDAARRALLDHFERRKLSVEIRAVTGSHWQIVYPRPQTPPLVSIIIPTHNGENLLRLSVGSLFAKTTYPNFEVIVVDNRSDDPATLAYLGELERSGVRVLKYPEPFNFSAINNFAVKHARGEVVCLCNNDIEVITPEWLEEMVSHAVRPEIGAVGAMLYYPNDTIQHAGIVLGLGGVANHAFLDLPRGTEGYMNRGRLVQNYSAVTGACLVVRRAVYEQVGGLNEKDLAIAFNDVDFCLRVRAAGYRNLWTPFAEFYHHESASRGKEDTAPKQARFVKEVEYMRRTWGDLLDHDPAYNSNLATERESFALAFPPRSRR